MAFYRCPKCDVPAVNISTFEEMRIFPKVRLYECPKCRGVYVVLIGVLKPSHSPTVKPDDSQSKN